MSLTHNMHRVGAELCDVWVAHDTLVDTVISQLGISHGHGTAAHLICVILHIVVKFRSGVGIAELRKNWKDVILKFYSIRTWSNRLLNTYLIHFFRNNPLHIVDNAVRGRQLADQLKCFTLVDIATRRWGDDGLVEAIARFCCARRGDFVIEGYIQLYKV